MALQDDELRLLQSALVLYPTSGAVIPGTHGIRKLRWNLGGKGKRGGLRIFYVDFPEHAMIFLVTALRKSEDADLTRAEQKQLAAMVLELNRALRIKS